MAQAHGPGFALLSFVVAFLSEVQRCTGFDRWAECHGVRLGRVINSVSAGFQARVQPLQGCLMAEEVYASRVSYSWADPLKRASLLILQHGTCVAEHEGSASVSGQSPFLLDQSSFNVCLLGAGDSACITVTQAPCRLVRLSLPAGTTLPDVGRWTVDFSLLLPMLRLFEQALHHPGGKLRRGELGSTLFSYLMHELESAGCVIALPDGAASSSVPLVEDEDLIERLTSWLNHRLAESHKLSHLASAVSISPRRLQEIVRLQKGCTPMQYLRSLRLDALSRDLEDPAKTHLSMRELMQNLGLPDSFATRRDFLKRFGHFPQDYRKSLDLSKMSSA